MMQATGRFERQQQIPLFKAPDVLTAMRIPLAVAFVFVHGLWMRLGILFVVAVSDVLDGIWARRIGGSRAGSVLDPIADKAFVGTAFVVVAVSGDLTILEVLAVLLRDMLAVLGFIVTWILGRPTTIPARAGGKVVTIFQLLTLFTWVLSSDLIRPLAWLTAAISVYAVADYSRGAWSRR